MNKRNAKEGFREKLGGEKTVLSVPQEAEKNDFIWPSSLRLNQDAEVIQHTVEYRWRLVQKLLRLQLHLPSELLNDDDLFDRQNLRAIDILRTHFVQIYPETTKNETLLRFFRPSSSTLLIS